ncbi:MAG: nucleotidyltransferase family protein [Fermentimonas sp.]|jgi:NDP-sugar pyrophosphorylase family protein
MKAMIFAAGVGSRLRPLTDYKPKALVEVGGKPLLQHTIEKLIRSGFDEIIINVHHFAEQIIDFVREKDSFGARIDFSDERDRLLDTGGGIKKAGWFFDDCSPFLVHNVDILSDINLQDLYDFHVKGGHTATLVCSDRETSRYLLFDDDDRLSGWTNVKTGEVKSTIKDFDVSRYRKLAFSGIHAIDTRVFNLMSDFSDKFSIIDFYLSICDNEDICCYVPKKGYMIDVGKPETLEEANRLFKGKI